MVEKLPQKIKAISKKIARIEQDLAQAIEQAKKQDELLNLRTKWLGRKGEVSQLMKGLPQLAQKYRPQVGRLVNNLKKAMEQGLRNKTDALRQEQEKRQLKIDITMPGVSPELGSTHPISQTMKQISRIFMNLGFKVVEGPEIETDYYNFTALNIPEGHPSRQTFHTFYLDRGELLRSQTSPVQIRVMEKEQPPLKIIAPGKVFRPDATDASHSFMFHQLEGLAVDKNINFADL